MIIKSNLVENLHVHEDGTIYIDDDRSILISISAFGTLRRDLIKNIGNERMKGFLIRYGWELGQQDAKRIQKQNLNSIREVIEYGPILHTMKGHVIAKSTKLEVKSENEKISIHMEGTWKNSYEAKEHLRQFGLSETPVCYTLIGYASGYLSYICKQTVIFKELSCHAAGSNECNWVGKSLDYWNGEVDHELQFYKESPIVKELEETYEKLLEERNNLTKTNTIHTKLTEEILKGNDLESIANVVYDAISIPVLVEDMKHKLLANAGLSSSKLKDINEEFDNQKLMTEQNRQVYYQTKLIKLDHHSRLITPIFLQGKIIGYCSFIYIDHQTIDLNTHQMIIERISSVCSLFLLNEKTKFIAAQRMKGHFLDEILRGEQTEDEIIRRGSFIHLDLTEPYWIITVTYQNQENNLKKELAFHEEVLEATSRYFTNKNIIIGHRASSVVLLVMKSYIYQEGIESFCNQYLRFLSDTFLSTHFRAGISKEADQIGKAADTYNEALTALRMTTGTNKVMSFDMLGVIGPLINQNNKNEIQRIARHILEPLIEKFDSKSLDLLKTLYVFLLNGGNLEQTAADITLSLSGLRYRLSRIESLLGKDLRNPFYNHQLLLSIQSLILTGALVLDNI
ncbi:XylR N-terminal domain-containing protein [Ectobacillus polymachus]|uniref:XylR N-terminal domain-containing protein n=1 Tax=Ectobacillus polymachus TaxID=1508806 RepID=UPI003A8B6617